ncbi:hypothetical protein [uncultured Roseobacter sp.]|uniref:hypothetical protein n=1 Tax=uncultured Roseobacter sp. TaxID=114847 RepID=UPI00260A6A44|nr:hypothetical protein [uncultured Roseobacter sp.]
MVSESALAIYIGLGMVTVAAIGFTFQPLTTRGAAVASDSESQTIFRNEMAYCRSAQSGMDCACFARTAGQVMAYESPAVQGFVYVDKRELARSQAGVDC